jgi:acyl-CoA reductase-like NAD-dependent aldehyde dehydrogenase
MTSHASTPPVAEEARRYIPAFVSGGERQMWIGGRAVSAVSGRTLPNTDPTTEQPLASVPRGEAADVDAAVQAAHKAFVDPEWARMSPDRRGRILNRIADIIERHADELATIDSVNMGAPRMLTGHMLEEASAASPLPSSSPTRTW